MTGTSVKKRVLLALAAVVVLLVVVLDTKVISPKEAAALNPAAFNAKTYGRETFPKVAAKVKQSATDVTTLAPAVERGLPQAGEKYGQDLGSGNFSFALKATGKVKSVDATFVLLDVKGLPSGTAVRIPLAGAALSGTPVRDCTGTITYGDFDDQTDYQSAANQFKLRMQDDVLAKLDKDGLKGKTVTVEGGWNSGGPPKSFIIQPTSVEVSS